MRTMTALLVCAALVGCGSEATPSGTSLLVANVEDDLPAEERSTLIGVLTADPVRVAFPDDEAAVEVIVTSARAPVRTETGIAADLSRPPSIIRSIEVRAADAGGYQLQAELLGHPENVGTEEEPVHARLVLIRRTRSSLTGTSMSEMTLRVRPTGVERI